MTFEDSDFTALLAGLKHSRTTKRRSAAKKLGKLGLYEAGPHLLDALAFEIGKKVTWETQFQLIRALGECGYKPALRRIVDIAKDSERHTLELAAAGMSIVRLSRRDDSDSAPLLEILSGDYHWLVQSGAITATAMLKMRFPDEIAARVIQLAPIPQEAYLCHLAVACAGWRGIEVRRFLNRCENSRLDFVREAAGLARQGIYKPITFL